MDATDLAYAGAAAQAQLIRDGEVSSREVVQTHLDRIAELEPQLNAFRVVLAEQALAAADEADAAPRDGRGPLHGVPIAIKDDVDVAGELTAWGTAAHGGIRKVDDAEVVTRLRAAGAIVLGKTNVPELTIWGFTETLSYGATRNPWGTDFTPGGSSGGSAAAVAAGLAPLALGSDGMGSIRIPAAYCHLFGLKPQRDRVPLAPHHDAWHGLSVNGPIARRVADAALFLDATTDGGPADGRSWLDAATAEGAAPLRIAYSTKLPPGVIARIDPQHRGALERMVSLLRSLGHEVVERDPQVPALFVGETVQRYVAGVATDIRTLDRPERVERRTKQMAAIGRLVSKKRLATVRGREAGHAAQINRIFDDVDVLLTPGPVGPPHRVGEMQGWGAVRTLNRLAQKVPFQSLWNATGQPAANLPAGLDGAGLPIGIQAVARPGDEVTLLRLGAELEAATGWADRRPAL